MADLDDLDFLFYLISYSKSANDSSFLRFVFSIRIFSLSLALSEFFIFDF
jgi:hypothetical protein